MSSPKRRGNESISSHYSSVFDYVDECSLSDVSKACILGSVEDLSKLINAGRSTSCRDNQSRTPLHIAAERGNLDCCKLLLGSKDTEIDALTFNGVSSLMYAVQSDCLELVEFMISSGANPSFIDVDGNSCLDRSLNNDNVEIFKFLLTQITSNIGSFEGWTIAHSIAKIGKAKFMEHLIIDNNFPFSATDYGITPLHLACQEGNLECAKLLVGCEPKTIECKASDGITPIFLAAQNGHLEILQYLVSCGVKANVVTQNGTVLHSAVISGKQECLEVLLQYGADVEGAIGETDVDTPLGQAVFNNCIESVRLLLQHGASPICCSSDPYSSTPLHLCFQNLNPGLGFDSDSCQILQLLVRHSRCDRSKHLVEDAFSTELALAFTDSENLELLKKVTELIEWPIQRTVTKEVLSVIVSKSRVKSLSFLIDSNYSFSDFDFAASLSQYVRLSTAGQDFVHFVYQAIYDQYMIIPRPIYNQLLLRKDPITANPVKDMLLNLLDQQSCQPRPLIDFCRFKIRSLIICRQDFKEVISSLDINDICKEILLMDRHCTVSMSYLKNCVTDRISEEELQYMVM